MMIIFAKDISDRDFKHSGEDSNPELKTYMEYQRKLFPYTVIRAGLDLAYKELDDILNYVENDYQKPEDAQREEYPTDVPGWFQHRFPWAGSFLSMEDMHALMVRLIQAMDSFRTHEMPNTYHFAIMYDTTNNIVEVYNDLLKTNFNAARDIRLSTNVEVNFDDFINNYWPHLEFMILSKPDFPHARHMERNYEIEEDIKSQLADGGHPLQVLEQAAKKHGFHKGSLELLKRDPLPVELAELESIPFEADVYGYLAKPVEGDASGATLIESEYQKNFQLAR